ncbi:hypothetical protein BJX66DRAFT_314222, partial [Aspergillus keveii]
MPLALGVRVHSRDRQRSHNSCPTLRSRIHTLQVLLFNRELGDHLRFPSRLRYTHDWPFEAVSTIV